ncbi:acyl-CoA dehydrogenase family protein, partial [Brucella melitensis]|uniref:acyl-CoA dehydrogenase family protein n=1 Tax=Brucella melitensis TaxID=29459 RepID=UPI00112F1ADB
MIRDPETLEILRATVNQFVSETLIPRENEGAETNAIPADSSAQMKELGFFGLTIPEEFGGLG